MTTASAHSGGPNADGAAVGRVHVHHALAASVTIPADLGYLPMVRSIAAAVGAAVDFDLDTIADLRMAADEMASILVTRAAAGSSVDLSFASGPDRIDVTGSVVAGDAAPVDQTTFGWAVLGSLVRDIWATAEPDGHGGNTLRIKLEVARDRGGL